MIKIGSFFLALVLMGAAGQSLNADPGSPVRVLAETDTVWRGTKFQITGINRIDATHILLAVRIVVGANAGGPIFLGEPRPKSADSEELPPLPFSLSSAKLIDESTNQSFSASPDLPTTPYYGSNSILTTRFPNSWLQLGVLISVGAPPPPKPDGTVVPQKVTIWLPKAKQPMVHVELPAPLPSSSGTK